MRGYGLAMGQKARIISPKLNPTPSSCRINFWYHMFGSGMGSLKLYVRVNGNDAKVRSQINYGI